MYVQRISEIKRGRINPQSIANRKTASKELKDVFAAENFSNLLEMPVLFYIICVILFVTGEVSNSQLALAWIYVLLRVVHSSIHITYNRVMHRWVVYVTSCLCLFIMWGKFAITQLGKNSL